MKLLTVTCFVFLFITSPVYSASKLGVEFPDKKKVQGKELVLNGIGIRKATWLKIKVYVGALYLEKKSDNPQEFLSKDSYKQIVMKFVRDVDSDDLIDGWKEAFENAVKNRDPIKNEISKLVDYMVDIEEGQSMIFTFLPKKVLVEIKGQEKEPIKGAKFSEALLSVWFINASDEGLRDGLLGKQ